MLSYKDKLESQVDRKESEPYKFHSKQIERLLKVQTVSLLIHKVT